MWPTGETMTVNLPPVKISGVKQGERILLDKNDIATYMTKCAEALDEAGAYKDVARAIRVIRDSLDNWQVVE